jgi:hypothetical protein
MSFQFDPNDIPKMQDQLKVKFMELQDQAYSQGVANEQARIIKVIEDSVGSMTADVIIKLIKEGTK